MDNSINQTQAPQVPPPAQQVPLLFRITTRYDAGEDRMVLWGTIRTEEGAEQIRGVWLTQRLLQGALAHWLQWLTQEGLQDWGVAGGTTGLAAGALVDDQVRTAVQAMEQSVAREQLQRAADTAPVQPAMESQAWLVHGIHMIRKTTTQQPLLQLVFLAQDEVPVAAMEMDASALRQWLDIVYRAWQRAGWSLQHWPEWMRPEASLSLPRAGMH